MDLSKFEADGYAVIDGVVEIAQERFLTPFFPLFFLLRHRSDSWFSRRRTIGFAEKRGCHVCHLQEQSWFPNGS